MAKSRSGTSYRFSDECVRMIDRLAAHHGLTKTAVYEMAVRRQYRADFPDDPVTAEPPRPKRGRPKGGANK